MMRSLSSGVAGLRTHQTRMDVVGNNIANVNTYGFKSSRTTFADVYYQNLGGASRGSTTQGGKNPTQIGYGSSVATIDIFNSVSGAGQTDRPLDVYIAGEGFLACKDASGKVAYTRLGNLGFDSHGNLVDGNGKLVLGFPMNDDGTPNIGADGTIALSELTNIHCDPKIIEKLTGISISPGGDIVGVLAGDKTIEAGKTVDYINSDTLSIPPDSNYNGDVTLYVGAIPGAGTVNGNVVATNSTAVLKQGDYTGTSSVPNPTVVLNPSVGSIQTGSTIVNVNNATVGNIALPTTGASYILSFDGSGGVTLKVTDDSDSTVVHGTYTGTIDPTSGVVELKDSTGTAITLTFDLLTNPPPTTSETFDITGNMIPGSFTTTNNESIKVTDSARGTADLPTSGASYALTFDGSGNCTLTVTDAATGAHRGSHSGVIGPDGKVSLGAPIAMTLTFDRSTLPSGACTIDVTRSMASETYTQPTTAASLTIDSVEYGDVGLPAGANYALEYDGTKTFTLKVSGSSNNKDNVTYKGVMQDDGTVVLKNASTGNTAMTITVDPSRLPARGSKSSFDLTAQMAQLKYQVKTSDDGGNTIKLPQDGPANAPTGNGFLDGLDGIEIEIIGSMTPFAGVIGTAGPGEDIIFTIGVLAVAKFQNPNGMQEMGSSYYGKTANSGEPIFGRPGINGTGETVASSLEMSNVDLSKEFTDMITTQRGFQANSRIITVSDTMLEELVNLKR